MTLWDVIEHMPDPGIVVRECWRLLRPGGILGLGTPDIGSPLARLMGRRWMWLIRVHLHYFTRYTMSRLLTEAGFRVKCVQTQPRYFTLRYLTQHLRVLAPRLANTAGTGINFSPVLQEWLIPINLLDCMIVIAEKQGR